MGTLRKVGAVALTTGLLAATLAFARPVAAAPAPINLLAGKSVDVGDVRITYDSQNVYVELTMESGWCAAKVHLAAAPSAGSFPQTKKGNPIPGKFPVKQLYEPCATSGSFTIPLSSVAGLDAGDAPFVAMHAEVVHSGDEEHESAWAEGAGFDGANWATYATAARVPVVLGFDDIDLAEGAEQPLGSYGDFNWVQTGVFNPNEATGQYGGYATNSPDNLAFIAEAGGFQVGGYDGEPGDPVQALSSSPTGEFDFIGTYFSAVYRDGLAITVSGFDDGVLVGTLTVNVDRFGPTLVTFDDPLDGQRFESIDRIEMSADDGDATTWDYFGFDDFTFIPSMT
jgi:hypothetical protein